MHWKSFCQWYPAQIFAAGYYWILLKDQQNIVDLTDLESIKEGRRTVFSKLDKIEMVGIAVDQQCIVDCLAPACLI